MSADLKLVLADLDAMAGAFHKAADRTTARCTRT